MNRTSGQASAVARDNKRRAGQTAATKHNKAAQSKTEQNKTSYETARKKAGRRGTGEDAIARDLLSRSQELASAAAMRLGWPGSILANTELLGRKVLVAAELRIDVHAERVCLGAAPEIDRGAVATWTWSEMATKAPSPAVRIGGVLTVARHWRTALAAVAPFRTLTNVAVILPLSAALTHDYVQECLPRMRQFGVSTLLVDKDENLSVDLAAEPLTQGDECDFVSRWVNELVYDQMLSQETTKQT